MEPIEVLEEVIELLSDHSNRAKYIILLALEARDPNAAAVGNQLVLRFSSFFMRVMYVIHPPIDSEVPGKSANVNWAVRAAHKSLPLEFGASFIDRAVVTVCDCDAKASEHYFNERGFYALPLLRRPRPLPPHFTLPPAQHPGAPFCYLQ